MQGQAPSPRNRSRSDVTLHPDTGFRLRTVRISELADRVGIPASTVRYYERIGLLPSPARTTSGYRDYDDGAVTRLRAPETTADPVPVAPVPCPRTARLRKLRSTVS
ncbi:MAG: MerR family DNA-binding transcriptional regulator [Acidimicrobiia bacterium]